MEHAEGPVHQQCFFLPGELTCHRCGRPLEDVFAPLIERVMEEVFARQREEQAIMLEALWSAPPQTTAADYWTEYHAKEAAWEAAHPRWWHKVAGWVARRRGR